MSKRSFGRIFCYMLILTLVCLSASCQQGTSDVTESGDVVQTTVMAPDTSTSTEPGTDTEEVTETTTAPVESETTTEPAAVGISAAQVIAAFRAQNELFFSAEGDSKINAEQMLGEMMPYLTGGGGSFLDGGSYQITNFVTTGDSNALPTEVISRDGVTVYSGTDPMYGPYREIEISHARGTASISTYDGVTSVDNVELTAESEGVSGLTSELPVPDESMLTESGEVNVWNLSQSYASSLLALLAGEEDIVAQMGGKVSGQLDARALESEGKLLLSVTVDSAQVDLTLELGFADIGKAAQHVEMKLEVGTAMSMHLAATHQGGEITEMHLSTVSNGVETVMEQVVSGKHVDFTMRVRAQDVTAMEVKMSADMREDDICVGTLNMTLSTDGEGVGTDILPLSASAPGNGVAVTEGEFVVQLVDDEIGTLEMKTQTRLGTVTTQMTIMMSGADVAVGESVLYYLTDVTDSADPSVNMRSETEIKLVSGNAENGTYALGTSQTDASGTVLTTAEIAVPAKLTPTYTAREAELVSRAERLFSQADEYVEQAEQVVNWVAEGIRGNRFMPLMDSFYLKDSDEDGITYLIELVYEDGYYIYADFLLDAEDYTYFYCAYDDRYDLCLRSGLLEDRDRLAAIMEGQDDETYFPEWRGNAIAYFYQPEQDLYVLYDVEKVDYGYMWTEPTAEDFPGRVLHKVEMDADGHVIGEIHDFVTTHDEHCYATLTCRDCGFRKISRQVMHHYVDTAVICEQSGRQPRTALSSCTRCGDGAILLTDGEGRTLRMLFEKASYATIAMENSHRPDHTSWERIGAGRDLTNCVIITEIIAEYDRSQVFGCDLVIPDLRPAAGLSVLGIRFDDFTYQITDTPNLTVVFPEGMEFIGCYGSPLFSQVIAVTLPETLRYISEGGMAGYQGETLVLPAALEYWSDLGFHLDKLKSLTIKGAHYESTPSLWCPNLEELNLLGTYDIFRGFDTPCKIKEFVVPNGVTMIADRTFENMTSLKKVVIPEGVTEIGHYAFRGCENLTEVILPASVTKIGEAIFDGCTSLVSVNLGGLTEIPNSMFAGCSALEAVTVSGNLTSIGHSAFQYCNALKDIDLSSVTSIGDSAFWSCSSLTQIDISRLTAIPNNAFRACTSLHTVKVGEGLVSIGRNAFKSCGQLRNIDLSETVTIASGAFEGCDYLPY